MVASQLGFYRAHKRIKTSANSDKREAESRLQQIKKAGLEPVFSPSLGGDYLISVCEQLGWFQYAGDGRKVPLSFTEILSYSKGTCKISSPWEIETVRSMSEQYIYGLDLGEIPAAIFPGEGEEYDGEEESIEWVMT